MGEVRVYLQHAAWLSAIPEPAIEPVIMFANLVGDGLRTLLDPAGSVDTEANTRGVFYSAFATKQLEVRRAEDWLSANHGDACQHREKRRDSLCLRS